MSTRTLPQAGMSTLTKCLAQPYSLCDGHLCVSSIKRMFGWTSLWKLCSTTSLRLALEVQACRVLRAPLQSLGHAQTIP